MGTSIALPLIAFLPRLSTQNATALDFHGFIDEDGNRGLQALHTVGAVVPGRGSSKSTRPGTPFALMAHNKITERTLH